MNIEWRPTKHGNLPVYIIGRTFLIELFHTELQSDLVRFPHEPLMQRAYDQLANLELEYRDSGRVYTCPPGKHDDLGMSCAMLAWAAGHLHLETWLRNGMPRSRRPQQKRLTSISAAGWT